VPKISTSLGDKQYCSAALLDIWQAFHKSMTYRTTVQANTGVPPKLFLIPKVLPAQHTLLR
jgi:hypothetical protein